MTDKTFAELEAQANAMIQMLTAQRNHAMDQCVNLMGQVAILEMRLKALEPIDLTTPASAGARDGEE